MKFDEQASLTQEQFIGVLGNMSALEIMVVALANCFSDKAMLWEKVREGIETKIQGRPQVASAQEKEVQDLLYAKMNARIQLLLDAAGCG